jgi:hypothetical protein
MKASLQIYSSLKGPQKSAEHSIDRQIALFSLPNGSATGTSLDGMIIERLQKEETTDIFT